MFNANFSSISAILWHEQILYIIHSFFGSYWVFVIQFHIEFLFPLLNEKKKLKQIALLFYSFIKKPNDF